MSIVRGQRVPVHSCGLGVPLVLAIGLLGGCASTPARGTCEEPPPFTLQLEAAHRLNPDDGGGALPTIVQVLQLTEARRLEQVDFQQLWQQPREALESELLRVDELTLEPGQRLTRQLSREPRAKYVVVLGVFRRPAGYSWRAVQPLPEVPPERCGKQDPRARSTESPMRFAVEGYQVEALRPGEMR